MSLVYTVQKIHDALLEELGKQYVGRKAMILRGKYKGRYGVIESVSICSGVVWLHVEPVRVDHTGTLDVQVNGAANDFRVLN